MQSGANFFGVARLFQVISKPWVAFITRLSFGKLAMAASQEANLDLDEYVDVRGHVSVSGDTALVVLAGDFDLSRAEELREQLARPEVLRARAVRLDVTRVDFLESVTIGLIVASCKRARAAGGSFSVVCGPQGIARKVFTLDGLLEYLDVVEPEAHPPAK
jgi:anti-sigma B factor antagonist